MNNLFYKLKESDLFNLFEKKLITLEEYEKIKLVAGSRIPDTFLEDKLVKENRVYLNKAKTVYIQPVHFYGGESFGEPHHWIAEIQGFTNTGLTRFFNKNSLRFPTMTY